MARTNAERQKAFQERRRQVTPLQRSLAGFAYTPDEQALADLIRLGLAGVEVNVAALRQSLEARLAKMPEGPEREALAAALAAKSRVVLDTY